ncbi:ABC transporter substrate-binding protein [Bradyrhizobium sp. 14AA]
MLRLLGAIAAVAAICSNSAAAQLSDGLVKIGVLTDMSGVYSDPTGPGSVWAAKKAVEDFNAQSKGMKVEVIFADHQNKADIAANIARQWYDVEKVDAIADLVNSSVALAVAQITKDRNKVALFSGAATSDLTGKACSPNTVHWVYDTWAMANSTAKSIVKLGGDSWFFLTADYVFGYALENDTTAVVEANGGKVVGRVRHPTATTDFASFLLQAQASKAKIIGLANGGGDTVNSIKQAAEFGLNREGQKLAALLMFVSDIHSLGLASANGLLLTEAWYWNINEDSRNFAREFGAANNGKPPTSVHAGVYSSIVHYLKAIEALGSDADGGAVVAKMKTMPTKDKLYGEGHIREDGRHLHPMYLFEVKKPSESKEAWDYYTLRATVRAEEAFRPLGQGNCPMIAK